jgi:bacterioferritin (cytochrome b1)/ElaB/YqjD/DUF883 family membrane-anchored ribosome-binding protein
VRAALQAPLLHRQRPEHRPLKAEFLEHAQQEQDHADRIAERIVQLNGSPNFNPATLTRAAHAEYDDSEDTQAMVRADLIAERVAIESYRQMIQAIGDKDPTTKQMLTEILAVEEEHADDMRDLLVPDFRRPISSSINNQNQQQEFIMLDTIPAATPARSTAASRTPGADMKLLVKDAQALLTAAASLTGVKADELRTRGMELLDRALGKAGKYQGQAVVKSKELARLPMSTLKTTRGAPWPPQPASACWSASIWVVNNSRRRSHGKDRNRRAWPRTHGRHHRPGEKPVRPRRVARGTWRRSRCRKCATT